MLAINSRFSPSLCPSLWPHNLSSPSQSQDGHWVYCWCRWVEITVSCEEHNNNKDDNNNNNEKITPPTNSHSHWCLIYRSFRASTIASWVGFTCSTKQILFRASQNNDLDDLQIDLDLTHAITVDVHRFSFSEPLLTWYIYIPCLLYTSDAADE